MSESARPKNMKTVDGYVKALKGEKRAVAEALVALVRKAVPKAAESIKWGVPWWDTNGQLCCLYRSRDHINLGFSRGVEFSDPGGLLEGSGKGMRHVKYWKVSDIKKAKVTALLKEALRLNGENPKLR